MPTDSDDDPGADPVADPTSVLEGARETVRVERRRTADERAAFASFRSRLDAIPATTAAGVTADRRFDGPQPIGYETPRMGTELLAVRDAYQSTVMSVPHYEEEYNDTYAASLAAEFGPELAAALTRESALHEHVRRSVLDQTTAAIETRDEFETVLEREQASVRAASEELRSLDDSVASLGETAVDRLDFGGLDAHRARLKVLERRCDEVATTRQRERVAVEQSMHFDGETDDVQTYLYQDLPVTYPVLAAVAAVGRRIDAVRRDVERAIIEVAGDEA
jgi:hypothetical protein